MHWMDVLRGAAVLLVVLVHASFLGVDDMPRVVLWLNDAAAPFRMPALVFASGLLLPRSLEKDPRDFVAGKVRGLLWPWLVWTAVMVPLAGWAAAQSPLWWIGGTHTWFLSVLFVLYMIALGARRVPLWAMAGVCLIAHQLVLLLGDEALLHFPTEVTWFGVFFFVGAMLRERMITGRMPRGSLPVALLVAAAWTLYAVKSGGAERDSVIASAASLAGVLAICLLAQKLPRIRLVEWMGRNSIVIYVVHWPVVSLLYLTHEPIAGWVGIAERFLIPLGVALAAAWLRPWTIWLYALPARSRDRQLVA